jgi:tyrosine-protein kinase Etk/Wzc
MQLEQNSGTNEQRPLSISEASLSEYFIVLAKHCKLIGWIVGAGFILSTLVSLLLPKMYVATARILPPQEKNSGLASLIGNSEDPLVGLAGNLLVSQTPAALYVGIMKSRNVADALNQKFKLKELYDLKYIEDVYSKLRGRSTIEVSKNDQIISVSVRDRDPQRAADMANTYVSMLDQINRKLSTTQGKRKRLFLEDRLKEVRADMDRAETNLKTFREKFHLVSIQDQAEAAIEGAARIKSQIIAAQTELRVFKKFGTEKQIEAVMLQAKIEELQKQLDSIEKGKDLETNGSGPTIKGKESTFYIPFNELPQLSMELIRLMREAKIQEKLFELLTSQYEMAQIEESRDIDTIQVLDRAMPPEKKDSPKRIRIILVCTFLALLGSVVTVFLKCYYHRFTL